MAVDVFAVPVFFIVFRETLEVAIIVAVLLAFLKQTLVAPDQDVVVHKKLVRQVWLGVGIGVLITMIIAGAFIGTFYTLGRNHWASTEHYWEGTFALLASIIISLMGAALLRVSKMEAKWRVKLAKVMEPKVVTSESNGKAFKRWCQKYAMFILPLVTVLREGIEAVVFIAGVSFSAPATSVPLPVVVGILAGSLVGYFIYKGGATAKLQYFLVMSTCLLYLVGAGLFSKGVWYFESQKWNNEVGKDTTEVGAGPGSYDITKSVWHVNYGSPYINGGGGWGIFNGILGWQNSATYGSVLSYNFYWIVIIITFLTMRFYEVKGHWPMMQAKSLAPEAKKQDNARSGGLTTETKAGIVYNVQENPGRNVSDDSIEMDAKN